MRRTVLVAVTLGLLGAGFLSGEAYADRQSKMHEALDHLKSAQSLLENASRDKGGHRARALKFVRNAMEEVRAGIDYDNRH